MNDKVTNLADLHGFPPKLSAAGQVVLGFAAVMAASFGPAWVVVPVVVAYVAMVV